MLGMRLFKSAFDYVKPVSDVSETGFGFSGFLHSICETETGFAKPSKPGLSFSTYTYSTRNILKYFDTYTGNYE